MTEVWQYPYVDIFKSFDVWEGKTVKKVGDVTQELVTLLPKLNDSLG